MSTIYFYIFVNIKSQHLGQAFLLFILLIGHWNRKLKLLACGDITGISKGTWISPRSIPVLPPSESRMAPGGATTLPTATELYKSHNELPQKKGKDLLHHAFLSLLHYAGCPDGSSAALCLISFAIRNPESW